MKDSDKEKLMGQRIISGADVTWEQYWEVYGVGGLSHDEVLKALKINISSDNLQSIEQFAGDPTAADYQAKFMQAVEDLKKQNPDAIYGETTKLTRAGTKNNLEFEVQVANDEPDSYEMDIENRVKSRLNSPLQPFRDAVATAKGKIATAFQIPTLPKRQKSVKAPKKNPPSQHENEFAGTENNRDDIANFGFDTEGYRNSDYVQSEAAKLKHDPTVRAESRDPVEEVLDDLRNEFMDKWYGAQLALRDKAPEKNEEKNYGNIMEYAKALNNILKACAEKTGAPEWMPDAKLMAPLQWMLAQRSTPELNALYSEVSANIALVIAREKVVAQQQVAVQKEAEAAQLKQWGVERMNAPVADDPQVKWEHYWLAYDEALQNLSASEKSDREKSFEAHRVACLVLGVDIKNLEDNDRTVFMKSTPETYRQNFMRAVVDANLARGEKAAQAERVLKNEAKLNHLKNELAQMNAKNFSEFISEKTIFMVMNLFEQYPKDRMVKEFVSLYMQAVNYFKQIAALEAADPIERAGKIADFLLQDGGRAFQVIVAFTSFENVVSPKYAAVPNPKNKPDIAKENLEKQLLQNALIMPFQWLLKYKLHLPLINDLVDVSDTMEKFDQIGRQANDYKREIDPLVKQMEQVAKLENSGELTAEKTKEIISTAQRINRLMPGLAPLAEKLVSDSDTESPASSPRSATPVTSDDGEEDSYDFDNESDDDPVVIQAPGNDFGDDPEVFRSRKEFERVTGEGENKNKGNDKGEDIELQAVRRSDVGDVTLEKEFRQLTRQVHFDQYATQYLDELNQAQAAKEGQNPARRIDEWVNIIDKIIGLDQFGSSALDPDFDNIHRATAQAILKKIVQMVQEIYKSDPNNDQQALYNALFNIYQTEYRYDGIADDFANAFSAMSRTKSTEINYNELAVWLEKDPQANLKALQKALVDHPRGKEILMKARALLLAPEYQRIRDIYAEGKVNKAADLFMHFAKDTVTGQMTGEVGADDLLPQLEEILKVSEITQFDLQMLERCYEQAQGRGPAEYYSLQLMSVATYIDDAIRKLGPPNEELQEKYSHNPIDKILRVFQGNTDPFTMNGPRDVVKVTRAYREIRQHDISTITDAILENPALADAFFKRRIGTRLPGRRNFRKEFAEHPELLEKLIDSGDPVILASMGDMRLLQTSHLSESNHSRLIDRFNESVLSDQEMLANAAENLEAMKPQETVADLIAELEALKLEKESKGEHQEKCIEELDKINNKLLANMLKDKIAQHPSEKFPDLDQMKAFVKDINDNLKIKDGVGLDYRRYLILLMDSKYDGKFTSLFKLESADFPGNNKGFQRLLPQAPSVQAKSSDAPKPPHHGGK